MSFPDLDLDFSNQELEHLEWVRRELAKKDKDMQMQIEEFLRDKEQNDPDRIQRFTQTIVAFCDGKPITGVIIEPQRKEEKC